ncbi:5-(carboxyamino)imidazole ribonucleotide mutase [Dellaglioa algida]|uniref:N5-carboxyaminoimidazole ribonucleotide mutase n=1 Tax=Dellaglioa algida DSM 15638 TaxID=1423719 RepID=A0A0R1HJM8_9LACO|nr:5-(carboxyamino)imidazole ribonucleotide mutase [Dellaglioa algida]KRK46559.1 purE protein [Dellaglioa algida DSM 15638]MDK1732524.1 5-(carboxyamino)imidazole ribonucleotide mutase [Dellaglioa algida]MDK1734088.1 5-(carboxyamino)imidazole ribonucleotide mutase [Dellaglioa algida]
MAEVAIVMGSISDWTTMVFTANILDELKITYDKKVISAHRMPAEMSEFAMSAEENGYKVIIAGAGGAAHLPGMIASSTSLPVVGVPVQSHALSGMDSLLSIVQMPAGTPVATMAIGKAGATNAGIFAAKICGLYNSKINDALKVYQLQIRQKSLESSDLLD